ncbi:MFS transporter [Streptomyces sp. NPDC093586]|uniref:MFS transporter n=1 Tax=Streptomyces sp. NPDC093586 TaxID=3366042 RepID=UPI0038198CAD
MSSTDTSSARPTERLSLGSPLHRKAGRDRRHETGFWLAAAAFFLTMAFSTVPTPLYVLYAEQHTLSPLTITYIFAVYAVGVIAGLITVGHISDWAGRKKVLLAGVVVEVLAGLFFIGSTELPMLIAGRLISGAGIGAITATSMAYLHELHDRARPAAGRGRFDTVSGIANLGGLGAGALIAGALAQWAPRPLLTPYLIFLGLMIVSGLLLAAVAPETVRVPRAERPGYRLQRPRVSESALGRALKAASAVAAFAVFGLFTSLAPGFVGGTLGHPSRLLAGTVAFLIFGVAPFAQIASARMPASGQLMAGTVGELIGLGFLATAMETKNLALFLISAVVLGAGAGVLFKASIGRAMRVSKPEQRGEAMAALFLVSYAGLVAPAVGVGIATQYMSATTAMLWFSAVVGAVLIGIALLARAAHRADQSAVAASAPTALRQ